MTTNMNPSPIPNPATPGQAAQAATQNVAQGVAPSTAIQNAASTLGKTINGGASIPAARSAVLDAISGATPAQIAPVPQFTPQNITPPTAPSALTNPTATVPGAAAAGSAISNILNYIQHGLAQQQTMAGPGKIVYGPNYAQMLSGVGGLLHGVAESSFTPTAQAQAAGTEYRTESQQALSANQIANERAMELQREASNNARFSAMFQQQNQSTALQSLMQLLQSVTANPVSATIEAKANGK